MAVVICAPLVIAKPSFAAGTSVGIPARRIASGPGSVSPPKRAWPPSPNTTRPRCDSGARSPEDPQLPRLGTRGVTPRSSIVSSVSTSSGVHPDAPRASAFARNSIIARTTSSGASGPTPAACERIRLRESWDVSSGSIRTRASEPNPVFTP